MPLQTFGDQADVPSEKSVQDSDTTNTHQQ
jgi:hypothetical protein